VARLDQRDYGNYVEVIDAVQRDALDLSIETLHTADHRQDVL
jgi:hypothetical protein